MEKSNRLVILLFFITFALSSTMYGEVYSIINSQEKVIGKTDCWLVKYSLWEDHDTMNPSDDTKIGDYTTIVGDCSDESFRNDLTDIDAITLAEYSVYPNPINDYLDIYFPNNGKSRQIKWIIYDMYGNTIKNGLFDFDKNDSEIKTINTEHFNSGSYIFQIIEDNKTFSKKILISK